MENGKNAVFRLESGKQTAIIQVRAGGYDRGGARQLATTGREHSQTVVRKAETGSPGERFPRKQRPTDTVAYARVGPEAAAWLQMSRLTGEGAG